MTVETNSSRKTYAGDNVTVLFDTAPVIFFDSSDLVVSVTNDTSGVSTPLTENTDYQVVGGDGGFGILNFNSGSSPYGPLLSGTTLVVLRVLPATQTADFVNGDNSDAEVAERALDKLTMLAQQLEDSADRSIKLPASDTSGSTTEVPSASTRAGTLLGFDAVGLLTTYVVQIGTSIVDLAAAAGSSLIGFIQAGTGAVLRTVQSVLRERISVKDFGAVGDGVTNDTAALQAAIDWCKANGRNLKVPVGAYNHTGLSLDGTIQGISIRGEVDPSGATDFTKCSTLRYTSAGAGIAISGKSSYGVSLEKLAITFNNAAYTGDLVRTGHSVLATDTAFFTMDRCVLSGEGGAIGANSGFFTDQSIIERVHKCTFKFMGSGIKNGTSYTNVITIEDCTFQALTSHNVLIDGTTLCQSWYFKGNTFEALVNGKASGIDLTNTTATMEGLTVIGNWFGDATVAGGLSWLKTKGSGVCISGNFFGTAGGGAGDYAIELSGCDGVNIHGNRFDEKAVNISTSSTGVVISGNSMVVGATAIAFTGTAPVVYGNPTFPDTYGGLITLGAVTTPKLKFTPSSGATRNGAIAQNTNTLYFSDETGGANTVSILLDTGQLYPSTELKAAQTAAGLFAGTGVPNNANGNNGDFYFRGDGTQAGNTVIYHKQAGAWVALITT